ncbi:MAG: M12 family metallopeptidase [Phycisphaerae bacterium]
MRIPTLLTTVVLLTGGVALGQNVPEPLREDQDKYAPVNSIPEGYMFIEGDIVVPEDYFETGGERGTYGGSRWPNGILPYVFDANVSATNRSRAINGMAQWEAVVNVDFRPRNGEADYLHIQNATFNASEGVGMAGGRHDIWITSWTNTFIIAHEFGHALAYWHEQSRADRGTACNGGACIQVNLGNVCQNCCSGSSCNSQFAVRGGGGEYGPYDFDSVMHYGQCSFSSCGACPNDGTCTAGGRTITVLPPNDTQWQGAIGQRNHLSDWDVLVMSFLYPEDNWRFVDRVCQCPFLTTCLEFGTFSCPYRRFSTGVSNTPARGTLWILRPGNYAATGTHSKAMTLRAPLGGVVLGN